jgi:hypothetical protein
MVCCDLPIVGICYDTALLRFLGGDADSELGHVRASESR